MKLSMKLIRRMLVAALAAAASASAVMTAASPSALAQAGDEIDLEVFYRELQPHGEWFRHERWGEVWRPNVDGDWRPYTRGHWAWTEDHGWMWVAEEQWGWATFHYGRWVFDEQENFWIWIPGSQWAPAWVQWRESEDQIGWAPLPPESYLDDGVMRFNASTYDNSRYSRYWVFVPPRFLFEPGLYRHISPVSRQSSFFRSTRPVTVHHHMYRGNIYHPGPDWRRVERWAGRPVPVVTLRTVTNSRDQGWRRLGPNPSVLPIYRPRVAVAPDRTRQPLPNVDPRPERDWRRGDPRPERDFRRGDPRPDSRPSVATRPSQPDYRLGPGGWQPDGRTQPPAPPPPADPSRRRTNIQTDPPITPDGRLGRPGSGAPARVDPPRPTTQPPTPPAGGNPPGIRPAPVAGPVPTPWSPPNRSQPPPAGQGLGPARQGKPSADGERPSNDR